MSAFLDAFEEALIADQMRDVGKRIEWWRYRTASIDSDGRCAYCAAPLDHHASTSRVDYLLPPELGGPHSKANLVAACARCMDQKRYRDWLARGKAPSKSGFASLADRRLSVLAESANHLLRSRETAKTKPYVLTLLRQRWAQPRFTIRAALTEHGGLVGITGNERHLDETALRIRQLGGQPAPCSPRIFEVPASRFHGLIWQLIDMNAWVRRLDPGPAFPDSSPEDDGVSRWHEIYSSVGDVHRRREKLPWVHPAKRPPWHEKPMDPRTRLQLAGLHSLRTGRPIDREWLARNRQADEAFIEAERAELNRVWLTSTSPTFSTRSLEICGTCTRPSLPGEIVTKRESP